MPLLDETGVQQRHQGPAAGPLPRTHGAGEVAPAELALARQRPEQAARAVIEGRASAATLTAPTPRQAERPWRNPTGESDRSCGSWKIQAALIAPF